MDIPLGGFFYPWLDYRQIEPQASNQPIYIASRVSTFVGPGCIEREKE